MIHQPSPRVHPELLAHAEQFTPRVEHVTDSVLVAIGYGLANTVLLVGDDGLVVVDVMESLHAAEAARDALLAALSPDERARPVRAVIYTHGHPDHVWGGRAWIPEGAEAGEQHPDGIAIWAHESVPQYVNEFANILAPRYTLGGLHMYGALLPDNESGFVANGIGPRLQAGGDHGYVAPTHTFTQHEALTLAGIEVELHFGPGESPDEIFVWMPAERVLLSADTVYRSFPNIYTIRGARYREPRDWWGTVDAMRALGAEHLVPCHGGPVSGAEDVQEILTTYRDGIQYVFDQTIRGMNQGLTPDELVGTVHLPSHLAEHPYLREIYGSVPLCVREIHAGLYGWFSGDGADLLPPPPAEESSEIVALAGGFDAARSALEAAVQDGRHQWAARLASHLLRLEPDHEAVRAAKAASLRAMAYGTANANLRNWWLSEAARLADGVPVTIDIATKVARERAAGLLAGVPIQETIATLPTRLNPVLAADVQCAVQLTVRDAETSVLLHLRHGVCAVEDPDTAATSDVHVTLSTATLLALLTGERTWRDALQAGDADLVGERDRLLEAVSCFDGWHDQAHDA